MFKKSQRFSFQSGIPKFKKITPLFAIRYQKSEAPTYAVIAGKKVSKKAIQRNKVKRMVRDALQEVLQKQSNAHDLLVFLRLPFPEYKKSAIITELENFLTHLSS